MRFLKNGELLTKNELYEILNNFYVTRHARKRIYERGIDIKTLKRVIMNPYIAYYNTDGTINIAKDRYNYFVVDWEKERQNFKIITYKEKSKNNIDILEKFNFARLGIDRK